MSNVTARASSSRQHPSNTQKAKCTNSSSAGCPHQPFRSHERRFPVNENVPSTHSRSVVDRLVRRRSIEERSLPESARAAGPTGLESLRARLVDLEDLRRPREVQPPSKGESHRERVTPDETRICGEREGQERSGHETKPSEHRDYACEGQGWMGAVRVGIGGATARRSRREGAKSDDMERRALI